MRRPWPRIPWGPTDRSREPFRPAEPFLGQALGSRRALPIAFAASIALHVAVLMLLAGDGRQRREVFPIALHAGPGGGAGSSAGVPGGGDRIGGDIAPPAIADVQIQEAAPVVSAKAAPAPRQRSEAANRDEPRTSKPPRTSAVASTPQRTAPRHVPRLAVKRGAHQSAAPINAARTSPRRVAETSVPASAPDIVARSVAGASGPGAGSGPGGGSSSGPGSGAGGPGGSGSLQASCLACPAPEYPRQARRRGWEGVVDLRLQLDAAGRVTAVEVARASGFTVLDQAAMNAARRSRFRVRGGSPRAAAVWGRMRYRFELGDG